MGRAYQNRKESMAKTSDQKARVYSRYAREIYVSAKAGGLDPSGNLELRSLMERAKKEQVPSHVIDKAIDKAEGGGGEDFARAVYEGYGPAGSMAIIECLTDNPNRTFGDVRQAFTKTKTKIGTPGSVAHMFDHTAILAFKSDDEEGALEALMMADVDVTDIENEEGIITVFAPPNEYAKAKKSLLEAFGELDFEMDEIQYVPQATLKLEGEELELFNKFVDMLDYLEDVQNVYHNIDR